MTTQVPVNNPQGSGHTVNVAQSAVPNSISFIEPGDELVVTLHSGNIVTLSEGEEVPTGPQTPGSGLAG